MTLPFEDDADRRAQLESLGEQWSIDDRVGFGILNNDYLAQDIEGGHAVGASQPVLTVCDADFPEVRINSQVQQIAGVQQQFVVAHPPQPDGTGMIRLWLNKL